MIVNLSKKYGNACVNTYLKVEKQWVKSKIRSNSMQVDYILEKMQPERHLKLLR